MNAKITVEHLNRSAIVYVRQSTLGQVVDHSEGRLRQYALVDTARALGFSHVETIDDDLGRSGGGFADRPGFRRLLTEVSSGRVGAVLALEASRLARNDRDWSNLVELGAVARVVLIDHDGIYDPRIVNDRLLLGLKSIMSQFELVTLRQRANEAKRTKAARGELHVPLPTGLTYGPTGAIELDPDVRVQQSIRLVFSKFHELGSIRQTLLWFRQEALQVPVARDAKRMSRNIEWCAPTYNRVHGFITNPMHAGAYAFGRTESRTAIVEGRIERTEGHDKPREAWHVLIHDHHPGYIGWDEFLRNVALIEENTFMKPATGRKSARGGKSLLSGLLRCRRCGQILEVHYRGSNGATAAFRCGRGHHAKGDEWCISFLGTRVEEAVTCQILRAVEGHAVEAAIEAAKRGDERRLEQRKAITFELEQAQYEAQLAGRRHEKVDPDQRLVAAELEARWNTALGHVAAVETRLREFDVRGESHQHADEEELRALARRLPVLWSDPTTDMRLKQRLARIVIHEIIADVDDKANDVVLLIHWQGGRHTEVRVQKTLRGRTRRSTEADVVALVTRMAGRWSDHAIATALNRIGFRTGAGENWNRARLRALRSRLNLPACDPSRRDDAALTCEDAAQRLGITAQYLGRLLAKGIVPGTQIAPGAPWVIDGKAIDSPEVRNALRALSERRLPTGPDTNQNLTIPGL